MRLLITGVSGMLGHALIRLASEEHEAWGSYKFHPVSFPQGQTFAMDLVDETQVKERVMSLRPEAIVHAAALTGVDECEKDPLLANRINVQATKSLARMAGELGAGFIYISTDYVFDGSKGDYAETDTPSPISVYGTSKLLGEEAVRASCPRALVIRTSIFGFNIQNKAGAVEYVLKSLRRGEPITRFADQFATPIYTGDLSRLILELLARGSEGVFHVSGGEKVSRYTFALKVADVFSLSREMIRPVPFKHLEGLAKRPRDSSLSGEKVERHLEMQLPKVEEGLGRLRKDLNFIERSPHPSLSPFKGRGIR